jgi:hypothetical protein
MCSRDSRLYHEKCSTWNIRAVTIRRTKAGQLPLGPPHALVRILRYRRLLLMSRMRVRINRRSRLGAAVAVFPLVIQRRHAMIAKSAKEYGAALHRSCCVISHSHHCLSPHNDSSTKEACWPAPNEEMKDTVVRVLTTYCPLGQHRTLPFSGCNVQT